MIFRRKDYFKKEPSRKSHKIYIICEGKGTEPDYFGFFEGLSTNLQIITIPPENGTDPLKLMELACKVLLGDERKYTVDYAQHDRVWFVVDTDTWEKEGKIAPLRKFCQDRNDEIQEKYDEVKTYSAWNVAQSNPCFEIWLYYHFYEEKPLDENVEPCPSFKDFVGKSIAGGYDYGRDQIYLSDAIRNAESNFSEDKGSLALYTSEMFRLGKEIYGFVSVDLEKLKNKLR